MIKYKLLSIIILSFLVQTTVFAEEESWAVSESEVSQDYSVESDADSYSWPASNEDYAPIYDEEVPQVEE